MKKACNWQSLFFKNFNSQRGFSLLANVIEVGYVKETGYMWIVQQNKVEHEFKMITKLVSYDTEINGYIEKKKIKKLKGVKAKELMLWPPVSEIKVDDPPTRQDSLQKSRWDHQDFPC
ncbi:hypothetical protein Patl1_02429 [Pistacia atlantica]|uniref:Uncharacterized protein n=1 Tax=Pistacia atlantica TaxID=434234 RepID=A0ACC1C9W3_9ROSI|nr:hypothetical protein Patl1_02429 [Pistacia atlantica]